MLSLPIKNGTERAHTQPPPPNKECDYSAHFNKIEKERDCGERERQMMEGEKDDGERDDGGRDMTEGEKDDGERERQMMREREGERDR